MQNTEKEKLKNLKKLFSFTDVFIQKNYFQRVFI